MDEILKCDHSNERYWTVLSCGAVYWVFTMLYKVVLTFESVDEILKCGHSNELKGTEKYSPVVLFIILYKVILF